MRISIDIASLSHLAPIPTATRIGPLITCSITSPYNPGTRECPDAIAAQVENLFHHVGQMLDAAEATWEHIAKMTFYVVDLDVALPALNQAWTEKFPDETSRPSRHSVPVADDGSGIKICCDFIAFTEGS